MWIRDIKMGKHLLPVYADLLYRLQHNALFLGYRFKHRDESLAQCHHSCGTLETAPHLFWYCTAALQVWSMWLPPFQDVFETKLEWESILFFKLKPTPAAKKEYGYCLFAMLNIIRAIFRCLWMHQNDLRFHGMQPNVIDVQAQVTAIIKLHVKRFYQDLLQKSLSHSGLKCNQLQTLLRLLPLPSALIPDDPDPDAPDLADAASPSLQE
ncbi:hypothetical protein PF002_g22695 [Phytophthora fragariae]|nr:hypothetical protein PF004_g20647 [Phytophthora fragariae]KAE9197616.1 hypothetical protein PF002_g22695 [Phytophthora fragariae]